MLAINLTAFAAKEIVYQENFSPELNSTVDKRLLKLDNSGLAKTKVLVTQADRKLNIYFDNNSTWSLPSLEEGEKYFVSLKDLETKKTIGRKYLAVQGEKKIGCFMDVPYNCDRVEIKVYKQKETDPNFTEKDENFIGKTKFLMAHDNLCSRSEKVSITCYDKNWVEDSQNEYEFAPGLTPNTYKFFKVQSTATYSVGRIVLLDEEKNLLTNDEVIEPITVVYSDDIGKNVFFDLYIPEGVSEFIFQVFSTNISDNINDIKFQFHVKIDRK